MLNLNTNLPVLADYKSVNKNSNIANVAFKEALDGVEPRNVLKTFEEITKVYKESGQNKEISKYIAERLNKSGFEVNVKGPEAGKGQYTIVAARNVDKQKNNAIMLQAHMDIVGFSVDENGKPDDNTKKPIVLQRVSEQADGNNIKLIEDKKGEWLKAKDRTLGADDGIGVALALEIAEDPKFKDLPLEIIFTTDEETGMYGAEALSPDDFHGKYLINLDSEDLGEITVGCAGVSQCQEKQDIPMVSLGDINHKKVTIELSGGNGGHSGVQIHEKHINPIKTVLSELADIPDIKLISVSGGSKFNAIPKGAKAEILVPNEKASNVVQQLNEKLNIAKQAHSETDPNLKVNVSTGKNPVSADTKVIDPEFQKKFLQIVGKEVQSKLITAYDNGTSKTSQNLGVLNLKDGSLEIQVCSRSSDEVEGEQLKQEISSQLSELLDKKVIVGSSPIWQPKDNSMLRDMAAKTYEEISKKQPKVGVTHGGLESAIFVEKVPGLETISVGPTVKEPHSERERLDLTSVKPFYEWMVKLIEGLKEKTE
ncbi:MAG: hypothetical protein ACD_20C00134G0006 [uncultured bacterium]|nr:MAG: hypothetical protein ACD_20C00134G0006 [uncultured bacterium]HBH18575.1 hypothetical protein [Cyanobacteria bacterium UBA9579]